MVKNVNSEYKAHFLFEGSMIAIIGKLFEKLLLLFSVHVTVTTCNTIEIIDTITNKVY